MKIPVSTNLWPPPGKLCLSLSGGKDSTCVALLLKYLGIAPDMVLYVDSGWEWPEVADHLDKLESATWPITRLSCDLPGLSRNHGWPTYHNRWCNSAKRKALSDARKHLANDYVEVIGIAADEDKRVKHNPRRWYPLVAYDITQDEALEICYQAGYDFGGIYRSRSRLSCYCCPLQRWGELQQIRLDRPDLWAEMQRCDDAMPQPSEFKGTTWAAAEARVDAMPKPRTVRVTTIETAVSRARARFSDTVLV